MKEKERTEFGRRLYDARIKAGLTQAQLAKQAGLKSQGTIAEMEWIGQGSSSTPALAAALGVTPEWLASGGATVAAWPFAGIVTPKEWGALPEPVQDKIRAAAELFVGQHRQASGKSSPSQDGATKRAA